MKNLNKILLLFLGLGMMSQCTIPMTIPMQQNGLFNTGNYHLQSQQYGYFFKGEKSILPHKLGTKKPTSLNWTFEKVPTETADFYRIKSNNGNYLHIEYGNLQLGPLGQPGWHSAMWYIKVVDAKKSIYKIHNRWKSEQYLFCNKNGIVINGTSNNSAGIQIKIVPAKEVKPINEKEEEPEIVVVPPNEDSNFPPPRMADPYKDGHPNLEAAPAPGASNISTITTSGANAYVGQIKMFAGNFAPRGWVFCNGATIKIADHSALFSILGTMYGGDGRTTFSLPDLRGRAPVHAGTNAISNTTHKLGQKHGAPANGFQSTYKDINQLNKIIDVSKGAKPPQNSTNTKSTIAINYIIATNGIYPSRN